MNQPPTIYRVFCPTCGVQSAVVNGPRKRVGVKTVGAGAALAAYGGSSVGIAAMGTAIAGTFVTGGLAGAALAAAAVAYNKHKNKLTCPACKAKFDRPVKAEPVDDATALTILRALKSETGNPVSE